MKQSKLLWAGVLVAIVIAVISLQSPRIIETITKVGGAAGFDFINPYVNFNGVHLWPERKLLSTATSTPCAIKSPAASSTLLHASLQITTASSTASTWVAAKAASAFATTTQLKSFSVGSANLASLNVNATTTDTELATIWAPNTYIVWSNNVQPGDATKFNGVCQAVFVPL